MTSVLFHPATSSVSCRARERDAHARRVASKRRKAEQGELNMRLRGGLGKDRAERGRRARRNASLSPSCGNSLDVRTQLLACQALDSQI